MAGSGSDAFVPGAEPAEALLAAALRGRRLRLTGLPPATRLGAILLIATVALATGLLVLDALLIPLPGLVLDLPGPFVAQPVPLAIPALAPAAILLAASILAPGIVASALLVPRPRTRAVVAAVAFVEASIAAQVIAAVPYGTAVASTVPNAATTLGVGGGIALATATCLGAAGLLVPRRLLERAAGLLSLLAAVAPAALLIAYLSGLEGVTTIGTPPPEGLEGFPTVLRVVPAAVAGPIVNLLVYLLPVLLVPFALWQATTWARAARDVPGTAAAAAVRERSWLLPALLAAKGTWLALGFAGWLPGILGGSGPGWQLALEDGPWAWLLAGAYAAAVGWVLVRPRLPELTDRDLRPGVVFLVVGFAAASVGAAALILVAGLLLPLPSDVPARVVLAVADEVVSWFLPLQLLTMLAAPAVGAWFLLTRRVAAGLLLIVAGAWAFPRSVGGAFVLLGLDEPGSRWPFSVELATLDAAVTVAIAVAAGVLARRHGGKLPGSVAGGLALALVVSTLVGQGGSIVPAPAIGAIAIIGLVFPPAYALLFESARLNEPGPARPARVLAALSSRAGALWLVVAGVALVGGREALGSEELGRILFAPAYAALVVGVAVGGLRRAEESAADPGSQPPDTTGRDGSAEPRDVSLPRRLPLPAAVTVGIAAILVAASLGTFVADPMLARIAAVATGAGPDGSPTPPGSPGPSAGPSPSGAPLDDRDAFLAFQAELVARTGLRAERISVDLAAAVAANDLEATRAAALALRSGAAADLDWLTGADVRSCSVELAEAYVGTIAAEDAIGQALESLLDGRGPDDDVNDALATFLAADDALAAALGNSARACGIPVPTGGPDVLP